MIMAKFAPVIGAAPVWTVAGAEEVGDATLESAASVSSAVELVLVKEPLEVDVGLTEEVFIVVLLTTVVVEAAIEEVLVLVALVLVEDSTSSLEDCS